MLTSLQTAISGMNANGTNLSVIADNIANLNTVGFKKSTVVFGDVLSGTLTGVAGSAQVGRGVYVQKVSPMFSQGPLETTENSLDMAIDGDGFFIVRDRGAVFYTRAGRFDIDKDGFIVNAAGLTLQGYQADPAGNLTGTIGDLQLLVTQNQARLTGNALMSVNLDGNAQIPPVAFTLDSNGDGVLNDPTGYNSSTTLTVFDSQGGAHQITLYYEKTAPNTWNIHYVQADPANPGQLLWAGAQEVTFDTAGVQIGVTGADPVFNFGAAVVQPQTITFDHTGTTQNKSEFAVLNNDQDGYASGSLSRLVITGNGIMTGIFTNGQTRVIGQVVLARFVAPTELIKLGGNLYGESTKSGQPIVSAPTTSGLGDVVPNTIELSNVDLAQEFINMISAQRGFQANSRVVTTTDELLIEVVNLKR